MATPKGPSRLLAAATTGLCCAVGFVALSGVAVLDLRRRRASTK